MLILLYRSHLVRLCDKLNVLLRLSGNTLGPEAVEALATWLEAVMPLLLLFGDCCSNYSPLSSFECYFVFIPLYTIAELQSNVTVFKTLGNLGLLEKQLPMTQAQVLKSSVAKQSHIPSIFQNRKNNNKSMWIRKLIQFFLQASGPLFIQVETFAACRSWSLRFGCCFWEFSTLAANCHQPSRGEPPTQCDPAACHAIEFKLSSSEASF